VICELRRPFGEEIHSRSDRYPPEGIGGPTPVESVATVAPLLGQKATERPRARHLTEATNSSGLSSSKHAPDQRFMGHLHAVVGERHQARLSQPLKDHLDGLGASAGHQLSPPHAPAGVQRSVSEAVRRRRTSLAMPC